MQISMESQLNTISLEAKSGPNALKKAITRLPSYLKTVLNVLSNTTAHSFEKFFQPNELHKAVKQISQIPYITIRKDIFPADPYMKVDYLQYTNELIIDAQYCSQIREGIIHPLMEIIGRGLSDLDYLRSVKPNEYLDGLNMKTITQRYRQVSRVSSRAEGKAEKPYGSLIKRQNDWKEILNNVDKIHTCFAKEDHKAFVSDVDELKDLISKLIARVSQYPEEYQLSGPVLTRISNVSYVAASAVEFYGITYRRAMVMEDSLTSLAEAIKTKY